MVELKLSSYYDVGFADQIESIPATTKLIAFSFTTIDIPRINQEIQCIRERFADRVILAAGGSHPSADPNGTLKLGFDVVFVGEGDESFALYLKELIDHPLPEPRIRSPISTLFDLNTRIHTAAEYGLYPFVEISRGCPYGCRFCQVPLLFGKRVRHRSPEVAAQGVEQAVKAGYRRIRFLCSNAFGYRGGDAQTREEALEKLLLSAKNTGVNQLMLGSFPSEVRPEYVQPKLLDLIKQHCFNRTIVLGAQSGSDRVLDLMNRGHTVEQARHAIRLIHQSGLTPHVDVLFCFPGESHEERLLTVDLIDWCITHQNARVHAHVYLPLPGAGAWPLFPEPLEPEISNKLHELEATGRLDGDWNHQKAQGLQILQWRQAGLILV